MESITLFLAQLWGPAMLAVGLGVFISKNHYIKIYREVEREGLALLAFGFAGIMLGIWHIQIHNVWNTPTEMIISLFGWGLLVKAALFVIKPDFVNKWGDFVVASKLISTGGGAAVALGAYLTWVGYLM